MDSSKTPNIGIMFRREHPPELLPGFASQAEEAGFDSLWIVEDCFYGSGIASATVALARTNAIQVAIGIMPAVVRNPVFTAMEIATLARLYPGRFLPGIGHGVASWMRQIGAMPNSQLRALEETVVTVGNILDGKAVNFEGTEVKLQDASLHFPPSQRPPIYLGVRGPKSLELSGRVADGTILAEFASPAYISWACNQIAEGQREARRNGNHHLTVFAFTYLDRNKEKAFNRLRPYIASAIASGKIDAQIAPMGILPAVKKLVENGGKKAVEEEMPDEWIEQLSIVGSPHECAQTVHLLAQSGADTIVLIPLPDATLNELEVFSNNLLPLLKNQGSAI